MDHKILIIDDEPAILRLLDRIFYQQYDVVCASSGEEAYELLKENTDVAVILSDQRMPGLNGTDFLEIAAEVCPCACRIILTGYADAQILDEAVASGLVYKHVTKPWGNENIKSIVAEAVKHYEAVKESFKSAEQLTAAR